MKKIIFFIIISIFFGINVVNAQTCDYYKEQQDKFYNIWLNSSYNDSSRDYYYDEYKKYNEKYNDCYDEYIDYFNKGYNFYENGDYLSAVEYYEKARSKYPEDNSTLNNLGLSYISLAYGYKFKGEYSKAIDYYNKAYDIGYSDKYAIYSGIGSSYFFLKNYSKSLIYLNKALDVTFDSAKIEYIKEMIESIEIIQEKSEKEQNAKENAPSNDTYSYKQYYINQLNIDKAQDSFSNNKQVIIAVIDDGININHPDLSNNIWINKGEIAGNGIDDDKNGFIDDYNGWNFTSDNYGNILPSGSHGTSVAGIIGAERNNNEGILGIVKNVKIMNLKAFDISGYAKIDDIINAMDYAIDNGANMINLSLTSNHLVNFSNEYDNIIKKAYNKGVIIVVAGGNGDYLSNQTEGVNTTINKLSPVCNDLDVNNVFGVGATDEEGYRTRWSNYGDCIDFYAPGANIFTLSVLSGNSTYGDKYDVVDGTSFSAPIISGIIGLGYNKYGKLDSVTIFNALAKSIIMDDTTGYHIDALKYLKELGNIITSEENSEYQNKIKLQIDKIFLSLKNKFKNLSDEKKLETYGKMKETIENRKSNYEDENVIFIFDYFLELINKEIVSLTGCDDISELLGLCKK